MKGFMLCLCIVMCCTCAWAEEADPTPIFGFAENYGAEQITRTAYESALNGKATAWETVVDWAREEMLLPIKQVADTALESAAPILLLAILRGCMPEANGGSEGARFLLRLLLLLGFSDLAWLSITAADACMRSVKAFTDAASPGIAALLAAMGMNGMSSLASPAAALAGGIAEGVFLKYGLPLCRVALCTAIAGNLSDVINLNRFTNLLKKAAGWGTGLVTTLFTALIALQGTIIEAADSVGVRTAKFAVDSAAPVIGNGVTEAWDGFVSGMMMTKNALGMSGITALLAAGIQPMVCCIATMLALNLAAALLELFGEKEAARGAEQIGGICQMALSLATGSLVVATVLLGTVMSAGRGFFS